MHPASRLHRAVRLPLDIPGAAAAASRALEAIGAHTLADRVDARRSDGDLQAIRVPPGDGALRSRRIKMFALGDRDQVVRAMRDGGWNAFEHPLPSIVASLVRRWPETMFDVGANTGLYSLIAVTADRKVRVGAVEAVPEIIELLEANLMVNPAARRVTVHPVAAGSSSGTATMHLPPPQMDGTIETSASLDSSYKPQIDRRIEVDVRRLDDLWASAGRPRVSLMKIDVEGAESQALEGAAELVDTCRPILAVEVLTDTTARALDELRAAKTYVDATLSPVEMVVNRKPAPDRLAPNHLLVPWEKLGEVVELVRALRRVQVTLLP